MKAFIHQCYTISTLNSIENGILSGLKLSNSRELIEPPYKEIIPASILRRMSKVIRMGTAAALKVSNGIRVGGIIVGSGSGCYDNSIIFTREYLNPDAGLFSPTSFIQSTDNTIAGQIAIILNNNSYNNTYIHKGLAFENALIDAMLLSNETDQAILMGGVDEKLKDFALSDEYIKSNPNTWIGEGASFFIIGQSSLNALARVEAIWMISGRTDSPDKSIKIFLADNDLIFPDLILYGESFPKIIAHGKDITGARKYNYSNHSGVYFTNSAFGTHLAVELLSQPEVAAKMGLPAKSILVLNSFYKHDFGMTYLSAV
ncbi:MAG TPA: beta-ketoacyl synthase chain length factor [Chitinophagaceae bacterium]|nr:beta-ketoacyl synthase chain length factor [Chitinophagaceae bacterium]